jgi:hypothetical protein
MKAWIHKSMDEDIEIVMVSSTRLRPMTGKRERAGSGRGGCAVKKACSKLQRPELVEKALLRMME